MIEPGFADKAPPPTSFVEATVYTSKGEAVHVAVHRLPVTIKHWRPWINESTGKDEGWWRPGESADALFARVIPRD